MVPYSKNVLYFVYPLKLIKYNKLILNNVSVQSNDQMCLNSNGSQKENQTREGEIKILKLKIKQLEIQLSKTNQEKDDKFRNMKKVIDCKDTELKFQASHLYK